jgi:hypothetical protein
MNSSLPTTYTYHLTYKFLPDKASAGVSTDGIFSDYSTHIKVYRYWPFRVVNLCLANKLPSAGEALDLQPLLPRGIDGLKTDILTIMKAH